MTQVWEVKSQSELVRRSSCAVLSRIELWRGIVIEMHPSDMSQEHFQANDLHVV